MAVPPIRSGASGWRSVIAEDFTFEVSARPVPTPVLAFETRRRGAAGAANFTASHEPSRCPGIKFSPSDGAPEELIFGDGSWILVHESGTENVARVCFKAHSEADLAALAGAGRELIA